MRKGLFSLFASIVVLASAFAEFSCSQSRDPVTANVVSAGQELKFREGMSSAIKFNIVNSKANDEIEIKVSDPNLFIIESVNGVPVQGALSSCKYTVRSGETSLAVVLKSVYNQSANEGKSANVSMLWEGNEIASVGVEVSASITIEPNKSKIAVSAGEEREIVFAVSGAVYGKKVYLVTKGSEYAKITKINGVAPNADSSIVLDANTKEVRVVVAGSVIGNAEIVASDGSAEGKVSVMVCDDMTIGVESCPVETDIKDRAEVVFAIDAVREDAVVSFALSDASVGEIVSVNGVAASECDSSWTVKSTDEESIVVKVKPSKVGKVGLVATYKGNAVATAALDFTYDYDVTFMAYDGAGWKVAKTVNVEGGSLIPDIGAVGTYVYRNVKYEYAGWTKENLSSVSPGEYTGKQSAGGTVENDLVVYAYYKIARIKITFMAYDENKKAWVSWRETTTDSGSALSGIEKPNQFTDGSTASSYCFVGWTRDNLSKMKPSGFDTYDFSRIYGVSGSRLVTDDSTFYAVYSHLYSNVIYKHYNVAGNSWQTAEERPVASGTTLPQDDAGLIAGLKFRYPATSAVNPQVEYVFSDWTSEDMSSVLNGDDMHADKYTGKISNNITVYATYRRNEFPVTYLRFNGSGWTQHKKINITSGYDFVSETESRVADPAIYVRSSDGVNFLFTGWTATDLGAERVAENLKAAVCTATIFDPLTVYATYKPMIADIVYHDMNGDVMATDGSDVTGKLAANAPFKHKYNNSNAIPNPIRTGYDFKGWYYKSDFSGSAVSNLSGAKYDEFGDVINLYAKWEPHEYTISYTTYGGTLSGTYAKTHIYDQMTMDIATESNIAKRGYTFKGWYKTSSFTGDEVTSIGGKEYVTNISLYAKWEVQTYNISYKVNGGTMPSSYATEHTYDKVTTLPDNPMRTGYTFAGWFIASNFSGTKLTTLSATGYIADITLYAKWMPIKYDISYNANGGTMPSSYAKTHTYDTETALPTPSRIGYTFDGWFTASNFSGTKLTTLSATGYTANITLYAKWTPIKYNISYDANGGTMPSSYAKTHTYDTETALPAPTKSNLTFAGWYTSSGFSGSGYTSLSATGWTSNVTLYARWTAKVTYSTSVGTVPAAVTVNEGVTLSSVPSVSATGYRFMGWFSGSTKASTSYKVTGHVTFTASWEKEVTSITISESTWVSSSLDETHQLTASAVPSDATHRTISWSSSDTSVATVDSTGKVTAKKAGAATIKAYVSGETPSNVCVVVVTDSSSALKTSTNTQTVVIGEKNYVTDSNQKLAYFFTTSGRFDIMGRLSTGSTAWSSSTYGNGGWRWKINDTEVKLDSKGTVTSDGLMLVISPTIAIENNVPYVVIYQTLINVTASTKTGVKFGSGADVQVAGNDSSPIYNKDYGKSMSSGGISFNLYTRSGNGVTPTTTTWAGAYGSFMDHMYDNSIADFNGGDSAMTYSWTGLTLSPGQSVMKSVRMTLTGS